MLRKITNPEALTPDQKRWAFYLSLNDPKYQADLPKFGSDLTLDGPTPSLMLIPQPRPYNGEVIGNPDGVYAFHKQTGEITGITSGLGIEDAVRYAQEFVSARPGWEFEVGRHPVMVPVPNPGTMVTTTTPAPTPAPGTNASIVDPIVVYPNPYFTMTAPDGTIVYENTTLKVNPRKVNSYVATIQFSAAGSYDPGLGPLSYEWKINGTTVSNIRDFNFGLGPGRHDILLTVTNTAGVPNSVGAVVLVRPRMVIIMPGVCTDTSGITATDNSGLPIHWVGMLKKDILAKGFSERAIILFSYSMQGVGTDYTKDETLSGVVHASDNLRQIYEAYPNAEIEKIAHSLGGVVALDAMNRFRDVSGLNMRERTHRITTVDSPLRGFGSVPERLGYIGSHFIFCDGVLDGLNPSRPTWQDLGSGSDITNNIQSDSWNDLEVISFAYQYDIFVSWDIAFLKDKGISQCVDRNSWYIDLFGNHSFLLKDDAERTQILNTALAKKIGYIRRGDWRIDIGISPPDALGIISPLCDQIQVS